VEPKRNRETIEKTITNVKERVQLSYFMGLTNTAFRRRKHCYFPCGKSLLISHALVF